MEHDRKLKPGDRVRVLGRDAVEEILKNGDGEHFPESGGHSLRFAQAMFKYCGEECVVHSVHEHNPVRYTLRLADTDSVIASWVWCPSMLEDPVPEQELEPADEDFIRSFFAEAAS